MKQSTNSVLKLSGKPINNCAKEKSHLTKEEMSLRRECIKILRNSNYPTLTLPSGITRKGFIRGLSRLNRWVIYGTVSYGDGLDGDEKTRYYSGMYKGVPIFDNNRIRVYKTQGWAARAFKRITDTGLFLENQLRLVNV